MRIYVKLGGSLITDKNLPHSADIQTIQRLAEELYAATITFPEMQLIVGHGSGSYGHVHAKKYNTREGVHSDEEWNGFIEVWRQARDLTEIVVQALYQAKLPVMAIPPSAIIQARDGKVQSIYTDTITAALSHGLIPVVNGDVIFDTERGGTIFSTEDVFMALADHFPPDLILLCGQDEGVWQDFPKCTQLIPKIDRLSFQNIRKSLSGSTGIDITGGMEEKVRLMLRLTEKFPSLKAIIFSGREKGNLTRAISGQAIGTLITN